MISVIFSIVCVCFFIILCLGAISMLGAFRGSGFVQGIMIPCLVYC